MSSAPTNTNKTFLADLARLVGPSHLLTDPAKTQRYRKGFRSGQGEALAVVFPGTLLELWRVLNACVDADKIILMQAANTGLTEGSTPNGNDYDREIVIISTLRLDKLHLLDKGEQVLAWPGTTLYSLEKALKPLGREPHSVIGSSCIGASVIGGICNNSGGSLVQRGPAYTEMSLFAQIDADGKLKLVNHLGIDLGSTPEQILSRLDDERISDSDVLHDGRHAHDHDYVTRVRDVDADTPARYNADPDRLFESSGCAGKLAVFAVRLPLREIEKPLWGLHPGDVRIAKIAERVAQQGRENAGIGITDDQKVAIGMFQPVAQVTGLIADIALTGDIVRPLLVADRLHLRATPVVKDMHLIIERTRIGHPHGVTNR